MNLRVLWHVPTLTGTSLVSKSRKYMHHHSTLAFVNTENAMFHFRMDAEPTIGPTPEISPMCFNLHPYVQYPWGFFMFVLAMGLKGRQFRLGVAATMAVNRPLPCGRNVAIRQHLACGPHQPDVAYAARLP